jgi:hypothetical protein
MELASVLTAVSAQDAVVRDKFQLTIFRLIRRANYVKQKSEIRLENTQEVQLLCNCCLQPYYPNKSWQDKLEAVFLGAERYAVCPVCTQAPPEHIFIDPAYRRRCHYHVGRLEALYTLTQKKH